MTRRKEKLLRMIDIRLQQLIEEEEYEMCARVRDWRKEISNSISVQNYKKTNIMRGKLSKSENTWLVVRIEEGDWETCYPVNKSHNFWLQIWGEEGQEVNFELTDNIATLKPFGPDNHEYTQD